MPVPVFQIRIFSIVCISCLAFNAYAQDSTVYYNASVIASGATTDQTPFWIHANQNGNIPLDGRFALANIGVYKIYNPNNPRLIQWSGGAQVIGSYGKAGNVFLSDAYAAVKIGFVEILAGQKNAVMGLMDTTLTSGSLAVAGNARPIPRVQVAIPNYVPLHFTNDFVSLKLSYSDGYLGGSGINYGSVLEIPNTYFHQKSFYLRLGNQSHPFRICAGFNHQAMWGGEAETMPLYQLQPPKAYWYTISGKTLDYKKVGNHFGTIDLGGQWKGKTWSYFLYRQNIYETGSLFSVTNFSDGLNGLSVKRISKLPKGANYFSFDSFLLEVLSTKRQINKSPLSGLAIFERGNYYNSYLFRRGWSYFGSGIGTPLSPNANNTRDDLPRSDYEFTNNNRVLAFHTGISATWMKMKLGFRGTYTMNYGSYVSAFETTKQQVSLILSAEKNLKIMKGCSVFSSVSSDIGDLYENSTGLLVGFRKSGFLD